MQSMARLSPFEKRPDSYDERADFMARRIASLTSGAPAAVLSWDALAMLQKAYVSTSAKIPGNRAPVWRDSGVPACTTYPPAACRKQQRGGHRVGEGP